MNTFVTDSILAEKKLNMLSNVEKATPKSSPISFSKNIASAVTYPPLERPVPSTKLCNTSSVNSSCSFITPGQFAELIAQTSNTHERRSLPIVDCRSQIDYGCERIRSSHNVNCRAKLLAKKLVSKRLEDVEPNLSASLHNSDAVILYDQSTDVRGEEKMRALPINLVVQAANKSNKKVHIIQGGFDAIKTEYPHLIECASGTSRDKFEQDHLPPTPEAIDKENVTMSEILPHIFVGNAHDAQNVDRLTQYGITHIINCTPDLPYLWETKYTYLRIDILDLPSQNIRKYFEKVYEFIDDALHNKSNNILVHCSAGISRSPTLVLAYMIKKHRMTLDEAFSKMRQLRQIVDPNVSFAIQLRDWEKKCLAETAEESFTCTSTRPTSSGYCGSTSASKTDKQSHTDSAIIVQ